MLRTHDGRQNNFSLAFRKIFLIDALVCGLNQYTILSDQTVGLERVKESIPFDCFFNVRGKLDCDQPTKQSNVPPQYSCRIRFFSRGIGDPPAAANGEKKEMQTLRHP